MLLDHYLPHLFENFEQFNVYTHNTVFQWAAQSTGYSDFYVFLHNALWYNYATWTNEMCSFQINISIQFLPSSTCFKLSWEWTLKVWNMQKMSKIEKLNSSINLKSVHFIGSCCIRIFWHYGQRKQVFPCLILISLLFDDSCKGTYPSDLAIVLSGRYNTHLVTLSSMSAAH